MQSVISRRSRRGSSSSNCCCCCRATNQATAARRHFRDDSPLTSCSIAIHQRFLSSLPRGCCTLERRWLRTGRWMLASPCNRLCRSSECDCVPRNRLFSIHLIESSADFRNRRRASPPIVIVPPSPSPSLSPSASTSSPHYLALRTQDDRMFVSTE
jgi:hypothetical protein